MEECVILTTSLARRFEAAMRKGRAVLFSAPCGFGKTASARALLAGKRVCAISAEDPELSLPAPGGKWDVLLVDDLQWLKDSAEQEALCAAIRENPEKKFVLLTRGTMPGWLLPFQLAGVLTVLGPWDLALDRDGVDRLLAQNGIAVSDTELTAKYSSALTDVIRREMYSHFDELVFSRMDLETRRLAMELAPFEPFGPELARIVSGNSRAGELLEQFQAETSALRPERIDSYSYWPIFRRYLLWKLEREQDEARLRALYARGGLYYELNEDYDRALAEILHQLEAVQRGEWEDWELAAARSAMRASLQSLGDSQGAMENYYLGQAATGQDESPEELLVLLSEVTPERIRAAAQSVKLDTVYFLKGREN